MDRAAIDYEQMQAWLASFVPARAPEFLRMEEYAAQHDFPIIGPTSGHLCYLVARLCGARRIFELGSGYGYSTAWFAWAVRETMREAMRAGGGTGGAPVIHHTVWDGALSQQARGHLEALGYGDLVRFHVGEAVAALAAETGDPFDIIFLDIDKLGYPAALPVIRRTLRPGGVLLADNLIWSGRAWDAANREPETEALRTLARTLADDAAWQMTIVPFRDGMLLARLEG